MKKLFLGVAFIAVGSALWWAVSSSARYSVKKWDAKLNTVLLMSLRELGLTDDDLLGSISVEKIDKHGAYAVRHVYLNLPNVKDRHQLIRTLEESGAQVNEKMVEGEMMLHVKRGARTYQVIRFKSPAASAPIKVH